MILENLFLNLLGRFKIVNIIGHIEYCTLLGAKGLTPLVQNAKEIPHGSPLKVPSLSYAFFQAGNRLISNIGGIYINYLLHIPCI